MADTAYFVRRSSMYVKLRLSNGKVTEWTPFAEGGLMETSDKTAIKDLREMDKGKRGGVREITKEEYEALKKKPAPNRSAQPWQPLTTAPIPEPQPKKTSPAPSAPSGAAAAADVVSKTQERPTTAKGVLEP